MKKIEHGEQRDNSIKMKQLKDMEMAKRDTEVRKRPMNVINMVNLDKLPLARMTSINRKIVENEEIIAAKIRQA